MTARPTITRSTMLVLAAALALGGCAQGSPDPAASTAPRASASSSTRAPSASSSPVSTALPAGYRSVCSRLDLRALAKVASIPTARVITGTGASTMPGAAMDSCTVTLEGYPDSLTVSISNTRDGVALARVAERDPALGAGAVPSKPLPQADPSARLRSIFVMMVVDRRFVLVKLPFSMVNRPDDAAAAAARIVKAAAAGMPDTPDRVQAPACAAEPARIAGVLLAAPTILRSSGEAGDTCWFADDTISVRVRTSRSAQEVKAVRQEDPAVFGGHWFGATHDAWVSPGMGATVVGGDTAVNVQVTRRDGSTPESDITALITAARTRS